MSLSVLPVPCTVNSISLRKASSAPGNRIYLIFAFVFFCKTFGLYNWGKLLMSSLNRSFTNHSMHQVNVTTQRSQPFNMPPIFVLDCVTKSVCYHWSCWRNINMPLATHSNFSNSMCDDFPATLWGKIVAVTSVTKNLMVSQNACESESQNII